LLKRYRNKKNSSGDYSQTCLKGVDLGYPKIFPSFNLMPLSAIFQLYCCGRIFISKEHENFVDIDM
jgi:hypothetical protein